MSYIEEKYIRLSCSGFRNYRQKNRNLYNFSCPICGDSSTNPHKARGFVYLNKNRNWRFVCHNCGKNESFYEFLSEIDSRLHSEYVFEKFANDKPDKEEITQTIEDFFNIKVNANIKDLALRCGDLKDDHRAKKYLSDRKIPLSKINEIYYSSDINNLKKLFNGYEEISFPVEDRIVIPVQDVQKNLVGVITRSIDKFSKNRYLNMVEKDKPLIYGLDRINQASQKFVVEGPIDSMFLDNCVAAGGADLFKCVDVMDDETTYIFDNQPRNRDIVSRMNRMAGMNKKIVIWPENIKEKDINEMVLNGLDVLDTINKHTYRNLEALLYLGKWSKVK